MLVLWRLLNKANLRFLQFLRKRVDRLRPVIPHWTVWLSVFFLPHTRFSRSSRVCQVGTRGPVLGAGSAVRQAARPFRVGQSKNFAQVRRISVCRAPHGPGAAWRSVTNGLLDRNGEHAPPASRPRGFLARRATRRLTSITASVLHCPPTSQPISADHTEGLARPRPKTRSLSYTGEESVGKMEQFVLQSSSSSPSEVVLDRFLLWSSCSARLFPAA